MKLFSPIRLKKMTLNTPIGIFKLTNILLSFSPIFIMFFIKISSIDILNNILSIILSIVLFILLFPSPTNKNKAIYQTILLYLKRKKGVVDSVL